MDIRAYLDSNLPKKWSDLTKYLSSYSIATGVSWATKSASSSVLASYSAEPETIAISSSVICTGAFFGTRWPLYRWLHENRYSQGDSASRDKRIDLATTIASSIVTNGISIATHYVSMKHFNGNPALTGLIAQLIGGGTGAVMKISLDKMLGLVFPSEKNQNDKSDLK